MHHYHQAFIIACRLLCCVFVCLQQRGQRQQQHYYYDRLNIFVSQQHRLNIFGMSTASHSSSSRSVNSCMQYINVRHRPRLGAPVHSFCRELKIQRLPHDVMMIDCRRVRLYCCCCIYQHYYYWTTVPTSLQTGTTLSVGFPVLDPINLT